MENQNAFHPAGYYCDGSGQRHRQELCRLFARRGAKIGLIDRDKSKLEVFADQLSQAGVPCAAAVIDVRQREQVRDAVHKLVGTLGPADILIASAGICRASTVDDLKISELEEIVRTNFLGMVYTIEAVLPSMLERKSGQIAGISSIAGLRGIPFEPAYSASKAAVRTPATSASPAVGTTAL
jgi:NADP-dependent 3-hydroxy acid dehydrogenase YdfG